MPKKNCPVIHSRRANLTPDDSSFVYDASSSVSSRSSPACRLDLAPGSTLYIHVETGVEEWIQGGICSERKTIPEELPCLMAIWRSHAGFFLPNVLPERSRPLRCTRRPSLYRLQKRRHRAPLSPRCERDCLPPRLPVASAQRFRGGLHFLALGIVR